MANDILPDLEGESECGDEDTRKRYVMWRRTTLKIFYVPKHNEEICSAAEAPPGATLNIKEDYISNAAAAQ